MNEDKLYRLMDILDELKSIEKVMFVHNQNPSDTSDAMLRQYKAKKERLLIYFINEINAADNDFTQQRLSLIKQIMERFYGGSTTIQIDSAKKDAHMTRLSKVLSA